MAITGEIKSILPTDWKVGAPLTVVVKYTVHMDSFMNWGCRIEVTDGVNKWYGPDNQYLALLASDEDFSDAISLPYPMPSTPLDLVVTLTGREGYITASPSTLSTFTATIQPTTNPDPPPDQGDQQAFTKWLPWVVVGGVVIVGGVLLLKKPRQQQNPRRRNPRRRAYPMIHLR